MYLEGLQEPQESLPRVVVKLADWVSDSNAMEGSVSEDGKVLRKEASFYNHIACNASIPNITPRFYGIFNNSGATALVLDHAGTRLRNFNKLSKDRYVL